MLKKLLKKAKNICIDRFKEIRMDFPSRINIELTNKCNMNCSLCPRDKSSKPIGDMDFELYKKIINQISAHPDVLVRLHKDGEPLLNKNLFDYIKYAKQILKFNTINLATNGQLLDKENSIKLIKSGIDEVLISLNAHSKETYKKIRNSDNYNAVVENIINFIEIKKTFKSKAPLIKIQLLLTPDTKNEVVPFNKYWSSKGAKPVIAKCMNWGGEVDLNAEHHSGLRYPCNFLWNVFSIDWNGDVTFCNVDYSKFLVIGDVNKQDIEEIWKSEKMKQVRKYHLAGEYDKLPLCKECNYWSFNPNVWRQWKNGWR